MSQRRRPTRTGAGRSRRGSGAVARVVLLVGLVFVSLVVGRIAAAAYAVRGQEGSTLRNVGSNLLDDFVPADYAFHGQQRLNVLLIVEDITLDNRRQRIKGNSRSDTNIVFALDRVRGTCSVLSLPRDSWVYIPEGEHAGYHKLNAAHTHGGPGLLVRTVEHNLGISIDKYVRTNAEGFVKVVDQVGGVEVDVERDMDYDDSWQDFHVHLKKGLQHLDGKQAEGYVRWRKNNPRSKGGDGAEDPKGDLGRIERQQKVMLALVKQVLTARNIARLPAIARGVRACFTTDMTDRELISLARFVTRGGLAAIDKNVLPLDGSRGFRIDREAAAPMLASIFGTTFDEFAFFGREIRGSDGDEATLREPTPSRLRELDEQPDEWETQEPAVPEEDAPEEPTEQIGKEQLEPPRPPDSGGASGVGRPIAPPREEPEREWIEPPAEPLAQPDPPAPADEDRPAPEPAPAPETD